MRTIVLLVCALLLTPVWGAVSACADDDEMLSEDAAYEEGMSEDEILQELAAAELELLEDAEAEMWKGGESNVVLQPGLSQCVFTIYEGEVYWMSLTEDELWEYAQYLKRELNINTAAAAGILVNIQFESSFNPQKEGDTGASYGICQWRDGRWAQMVSYCLENGYSPSSMEGQLAFLVYDLQENYIYTYDLIRMVSNTWDGATDAAFYFCAYYEVPSDPDAESAARLELCDILFYPALAELEEAFS